MADIRDLDQCLEELRREREVSQIIFDTVPAMIWYKDTENNILRLNQAAAMSMGMTVEHVTDVKSVYVLNPEHAEHYHQDDLEVINSGKAKTGIIEPLVQPSGETRWLETSKIPYRDREGNIAGVIVFAQDITKRKRAEDALQEAHDRLEWQNRQLMRVNEFFRSTVEHMIVSVQRGGSQLELLGYLEFVQGEFERLDNEDAGNEGSSG